MTDTEKSELGQKEMSLREWRAERRLVLVSRVMLGMAVSILLLIGGLVYAVSLPREIVHIVEVNPEGRVLWVGKPGSKELKDVWIAHQLLETWIFNSRRRGDDPTLMGEMRKKAELMTTGEALRQLKLYHDGTNPLKVPELKQNPMRTELHDFEVDQLTPTEWEIRWREKWTPTVGRQARWKRVRGRFTVAQMLQPSPFGMVQLKGYDANRSPLGVYVTAYTINDPWEGQE
jgi:type IV secretory pathway TrbF-like protein